MKRVSWEIHEYTTDDDVIYHYFNSKAEALRKGKKLVESLKGNGSYFTLKKYVSYREYVGSGYYEWTDPDLEDDWDFKPEGVFDLLTKQPVSI